MSDHKRHSDALVERWARALGVSKEFLVALVKEVVAEREALGTLADPQRRRRLIAQPVE